MGLQRDDPTKPTLLTSNTIPTLSLTLTTHCTNGWLVSSLSYFRSPQLLPRTHTPSMAPSCAELGNMPLHGMDSIRLLKSIHKLHRMAWKYHWPGPFVVWYMWVFCCRSHSCKRLLIIPLLPLSVASYGWDICCHSFCFVMYQQAVIQNCHMSYRYHHVCTGSYNEGLRNYAFNLISILEKACYTCWPIHWTRNTRVTNGTP